MSVDCVLVGSDSDGQKCYWGGKGKLVYKLSEAKVYSDYQAAERACKRIKKAKFFYNDVEAEQAADEEAGGEDLIKAKLACPVAKGEAEQASNGLDLKGYKRGEMLNEAQLLDTLGNCKERYEFYLLGYGHNAVMSNWFEGRCVQILDMLGYNDSINIVNQWRDEALEGKANEVAGDDRVNCPHCQQQVTTHLDGMVSEGTIEMNMHNGEPHYRLPAKEPVQAVCFSAQPVANGAEVQGLEDETLCDGCHYPLSECICSYLAAEQAKQGDTRAMQSLGHTSQTIAWVKAGEVKPEEFLPDVKHDPIYPPFVRQLIDARFLLEKIASVEFCNDCLMKLSPLLQDMSNILTQSINEHEENMRRVKQWDAR